MELWMYLVVIGMFLIATVGTVWITLWTIQRGEKRRAAEAASAEGSPAGEPSAAPRAPRTISTRTISTRPTPESSEDGPA